MVYKLIDSIIITLYGIRCFRKTNLTFLLHVTNKQTTSIVKTIPVETPVTITTKEFVDGVISNVDLLPVTALESVTPETKLEIIFEDEEIKL